jgi:hypothetical protein
MSLVHLKVFLAFFQSYILGHILGVNFLFIVASACRANDRLSLQFYRQLLVYMAEAFFAMACQMVGFILYGSFMYYVGICRQWFSFQYLILHNTWYDSLDPNFGEM